MEKVGFIGTFDKTNLIMCIAKMLKYMDKKVLVVDTTVLQKTRYIIPSIKPTRAYIADLENIDFAIGFESISELEKYMGLNVKFSSYDYMLIDIDSSWAFKDFEMENANKNYFVTGFDLYSLNAGLEILRGLKAPLKMTKILCRYSLKQSDENQFNDISSRFKILWDDFSIYLPYKDIDNQAMEENQKLNKIKIKKLSNGYQTGLIYIIQQITNETNLVRIKKSIKE